MDRGREIWGQDDIVKLGHCHFGGTLGCPGEVTFRTWKLGLVG